MRYIWICIIDGCIVRSGAVQAGETMPKLIERISRHLPHMASDSMKVVGEDGKVYDSHAWFPGPAPETPGAPPETELIAAGVVESFFGVKLHHGATPEDVIQAEAQSFSGRIDDMVDFGVFDFSGEQLASIEDMVAYVQQTEPDKAPDYVDESKGPPHEGEGGDGRRRRGRNRQRGHRNRRDFRRRGNGGGAPEGPKTQGTKDPETPAPSGGDAPPASPDVGNAPPPPPTPPATA
ncbi:MAG: hypothetical protein IT578_01775 [Verrucomicrobiae bacterium]|nr:hypothetical protein [Verrucomicrobiae bacterium]